MIWGETPIFLETYYTVVTHPSDESLGEVTSFGKRVAVDQVLRYGGNGATVWAEIVYYLSIGISKYLKRLSCDEVLISRPISTAGFLRISN